MPVLDFAARRAHNQRCSAALVLSFTLLFVLVGAVVDYLYFDRFIGAALPVPLATLCALAVAVSASLAAFYGGGAMILSSLGAERLNLQLPEHRELHNIVVEMALASGARMPKVYVIFDPAPNALATGTTEENAAICVTAGLLTLLNREQTQGVIAHEMSHIRNHDILWMTLVSILVGSIALLADWARRGFYSPRTGKHLSKRNPLVLLSLLILVAFSPLIARILAMAVSRQREYLADASAAQYTRNPRGLAQALEKLRDAKLPFHKAARGTAHLFFVDPLDRAVNHRDGKVADLLASHPPIERRIELLYQMAGLSYAAARRAAVPSSAVTA
jgi:heat shock protein HtpX